MDYAPNLWFDIVHLPLCLFLQHYKPVAVTISFHALAHPAKKQLD